MDSEKFIEALESCPDEDLTKNLGIKDNWVIYLNGNLGNIITQLCQDNKYSSIEADILYDEQNGVLVRVLDEPIALLGVEVDDARLQEYNMALSLSSAILADSKIREKLGGKNPLRTIAQVVCSLGRVFREHKVKCYFPMAKPQFHYSP